MCFFFYFEYDWLRDIQINQYKERIYDSHEQGIQSVTISIAPYSFANSKIALLQN